MATSDDASSSTVNRNGDTDALTGRPKELPTLESIQRDAATLFEAQQNEIFRLKKLIENQQTEIGELQSRCGKLLLEKKATDRELRQLRETIETDADQDMPPRGLRSDLSDAKDPAAGDGYSYQDHDRVRFGGQHPDSDQSATGSRSSQVTKDSNDHQLPQQRAGNATAAAAAATAAVSKGNASVKNKCSTMMGASMVDANDLVTLEMVDWLAENISIKDWKPLLRKLGLRDGKIEDIIEANQNRIREQRFQGFKLWMMTTSVSDSKGTVPTLLSAMEKLSLQLNIREFCEEFKVKRGSGVQDEADSVRLDFSCSLHELTDPYLNGEFSKMKDGLRRLDNLLEAQCVSLKYPLTRDTVREGATVLSVLEHCSSQILQKYPGDKMGRRLELQKLVKVCGKGVRAEFKKFVCAGVVGPLNGEKDLRDSSGKIISKVEEMLSVHYEGTKDWKDLTSWLKKEHDGVFEEVDRYKMDIWEKNQDPRTGARSILQVWMTTTKATEGKLYAWLVQNGRNDIAKHLE